MLLVPRVGIREPCRLEGTMQYEKLFSPIKMRGAAFPNRIMRTSMASGLATEDGLVTDLLLPHMARPSELPEDATL